jgi:hypothetical protein
MVETSPMGSKFGVLEDAAIAGTKTRRSEGGALTVLSQGDYDRPDLAVTVKDSDYTAVVLGYRDHRNYVAFVVEGPLVYCRYVINGRPGPVMLKNALPFVRATYRLEVRHTGPNILFFVDDYLLTSMPSAYERTGRVGLYAQGSRWKEASFSHFVAEPSGGAAPVFFTPELKIP